MSTSLLSAPTIHSISKSRREYIMISMTSQLHHSCQPILSCLLVGRDSSKCSMCSASVLIMSLPENWAGVNQKGKLGSLFNWYSAWTLWEGDWGEGEDPVRVGDSSTLFPWHPSWSRQIHGSMNLTTLKLKQHYAWRSQFWTSDLTKGEILSAIKVSPTPNSTSVVLVQHSKFYFSFSFN